MPPVTMMEEYWKDDFRPLRDIALEVTAALKSDEASPESDLYRRLANSGTASTVAQSYASDEAFAQPHAYHYDKSNTTLTLKHDSTRALPGIIEDAKKRMKRTSFMGVLPALGWAYMTVDNVIYLFSLESHATGAPETLLSFENPREQSILAAQLVKPRPGIFKRSVEYCLVVTTVEDVWLLALTQDEFGVWHCVTTSFVVASEGVRLTAIAGTETGRIFLGGDDGCLHEFVYENTTMSDRKLSVEEQLESFYDGTKDLPAVVSEQSGKRSWWQSIASSSSSGSEPPLKARKLNRSRPGRGWLHSSGSSSFMSSKESVQQLVVDDERQTLSVLTTAGLLRVYDLSKDTAPALKAECHIPETTRIYLEAVGRGQPYPPPTNKTEHGRPLGIVRFPGGGPAAQAGVGGMSGARELLKAIESSSSRLPGKTTSIFSPAKLDVISCRESAHLTLLVVTHGGLRLFLSTLSTNVLNNGAVEASQMASFRRNPDLHALAPSSRITLCHVRAPPSLQSNSKVAKPNTTALMNWKVDASYHEQGQWLLAVEENNTGKNVLLSTMPDSVARKVPEDDPRKSAVFQTSGGLAETVGLPCDRTTLVGGLVWDFCKLPSVKRDRASSLLDLVWRSPTPANVNDLDIPPAYYPPSKLFHSSSTTGERRMAVAQQPASLRTTAIHVMGQAFLNFMLSRSLSHGLAVTNVPNNPSNEGQIRTEIGNSYRLSTRTGARGFSSTAAEKGATRSSMSVSHRPNSSYGSSSSSSRQFSSGSSTKTPSRKVSISARLQEALLRPMTIPLHHMATHHLVTDDSQLVALNAMGVHTFSIKSVMSALAEAIMAAGERIDDDKAVDSFFKSYGYAEGCAMTLALAIGCGPASGQFAYTNDLRKLSIRAVMARAYTPKIKLKSSGNGFVSDSIAVDAESSLDPFVPSGYEFLPSQLSQGLTRLFARLVRPVWNKPIVVVTEGRSVKLQWSHGNKITATKVELLLDDETLKDVRTPLESLQHLAKDVFKRAIEQVPGIVQRQDAIMDIDDGLNTPGSSILTESLHYKNSFRTGNVGTTSEVTERDATTIAHLVEERNIHSLYRLLCRVVQLLHLISLLRKADSMPELPQVDWGLLHGLTFSQMVQSPEGQERLETLLNSLVVASASSAASLSYSNDADAMSRLFAENCYLFFPPASRFAYQGIRCAMEALDSAPSSVRRMELAAQAVSNLIDAAKHWYSATLISGRLLRSRGNETHEEIVARACQHGSPLAKSADLLVQLGDVASVVEICLLTASNFDNRRSFVQPRDVRDLNGVFGWELDLYHKHRQMAQNGTALSGNSPRSPDSYGASVSGKDGIETCYAIILYHLAALFVSNTALADKMLSACTAYTDKEFLKELFQFLLDNNHADVLLRINSADVEKWLRERNDPDLLWRYYDVQGKKLQSGIVSFERATAKSTELSIEERIESLTRASNSLRNATHDANWQTGDLSNEDASRLERQVEDSLTVAKIQHRIIQAIGSFADLPSEVTNEKLTELSTTLLDVSSLYDLAASIPLTDICLVIFHRCRQQDTQTIQMLWTTLFGELLLPMATQNENIFQMLTELASNVRFDEDKVEKISGSGASGKGYPRFEDGGWIPAFENKIRSLGNELYGTGADYTFPVEFLLTFLEQLRKGDPKLLSSGWSLKLLAGAGVPFLVLLDSYRNMSVHEGVDDSSVRDCLVAQLDLLDFWLAQYGTAGELASVAKQELSRAKATGEVRSHMDFLDSKISVTPGTQELLPLLRSIEERLQYVL